MQKKFRQTIMEFHVGFLVGNLFNLAIWTFLEKYTKNSVVIFPWFYVALGVSYLGLWFQLGVVYWMNYRGKKQ